MRQFGSAKPSTEIIARAKKAGWEVDESSIQRGGDWLCICDLDKRYLQVYFNVFNGHFNVFNPGSKNKPAATHEDNLDHLPWYAELLELFYNPLPTTKYLILSMGHKDLYFGGEVHLFWRWNSHGYTAVMQTAGLYTKKEATPMVTQGGEVAIPVSEFNLEESFFTPHKDIRDIDVLRLLNKNKANEALIDKWRTENRGWEINEAPRPDAPAYRIERRNSHINEI